MPDIALVDEYRKKFDSAAKRMKEEKAYTIMVKMKKEEVLNITRMLEFLKIFMEKEAGNDNIH